VSAVGRTLMITTGSPSRSDGALPRFVHVQVSSRHGRTQVTVGENLTPLAGSLFAGLGIGVGVGIGAAVAGVIGATTRNPGIVAIAGSLCLTSTLYAARVLFSRTFSKREAELQTLVQRIVERARHRTRLL
jgi:hypothetical protein